MASLGIASLDLDDLGELLESLTDIREGELLFLGLEGELDSPRGAGFDYPYCLESVGLYSYLELADKPGDVFPEGILGRFESLGIA